MTHRSRRGATAALSELVLARGARNARSCVTAGAFTTSVLAAHVALAQSMGAPPPDATALVAAPTASAKPPEKADVLDVTTVAISAGGQLSTGNSRLLAGTVSADYQTRFSDNGIGLNLLGNYGESATPGSDLHVSAQNIQGRARYDRYLIDPMSVFLINTGRHDRFQGLDFRYNLDPGVKYLFVQQSDTKLWGELGYDFQYDIRRNDSLTQADGTRLDKTVTDHSVRLFAGFTHAFNDSVNLTTGVEYLQSVVHATKNRINFDALFAAKLGGGLALGVGFNARYDHDPLPDKKRLDTQSILSLIYSFSDAPKAKPDEPNCPPQAPAPACVPAAAPVPTAPDTAPSGTAPAEPPPPSSAPAPVPPAAQPTSPPAGIAPGPAAPAP